MSEQREVAVKVWDLPVRLVHWALVLLFAFQVLSASLGEKLIDWHMRSGYAILALVLFRVLWGVAGSGSARFSSFLARPADALEFGRRLWSRRASAMAGHNPLGGWMVVALLAALLVQVGTGLFSNDGIASEGPLAKLVSGGLSDRITTLHHWNFRVLLVLASLHVAAVVYHWLALKENLIGAMFSGVKRLREAPPPLKFAGGGRALLLLAISAALVWLIVTRPF